MARRGKLIVFEGADGSGKTTQAKLLLEYLQNPPAGGKIPASYISFPRYGDSLWGEMVKRYLRGDFGEIDEVDPYLASVLYAGDRLMAAPQIKKWLVDGRIVVCNRYVGSNLAHMSAKLKSKNEKLKLKKWLEKLEYEENGIPREDLAIFLHVPVDISRNLIKDRRLDIHEKDLKYLEKVLATYEEIAKSRKNWQEIDCTWDGKILAPEKIHEKVLKALRRRKILPESTSQFILRLSSTDIVIDAGEGIKGIKR